MTFEDDNERTERVMFGVPYKATVAEARRVWAELVESPAWLEFNSCGDLLKSPGAVVLMNDTVPSLERIYGIGAKARESAEAYRQCVRNAIEAIEAMEAERR